MAGEFDRRKTQGAASGAAAGTAFKPIGAAAGVKAAAPVRHSSGTTVRSAAPPAAAARSIAPIGAAPGAQNGSYGTATPFGGVGGAMGGAGFGADPGAGAAPVVTAPSEEDYLAGDSGFQTQSSALSAALQRYLADADFQKNTYETDYGKSLRDLGYDEGSSKWNYDDKLTASGRGYQSQLDDFGNRGMLQSSGYADALNELQRMLGQQYDTLKTGKQTFMSDLSNQTANYRGENTSNVQAARAEALQRRASQYGL